MNAFFQTVLVLLSVVWSGLQDGCQRFLASDAGPGELQGTWLVYEAPEIELGKGVPLVVKLQLRNDGEGRVRLPRGLEPGLSPGPTPVWGTARWLPATLGPGEETSAVWTSRPIEMPGRYEIGVAESGAITAVPARLDMTGVELAGPERLYLESLFARFSGRIEGFIAGLEASCAAGGEPPTSHFILAETLAAEGRAEEARRHYETFAEQTFGVEALPAWLRATNAFSPSEP